MNRFYDWLFTPEITVSFKYWILSEITTKLAQELQQWQSTNTESLPFNSLFKKAAFVPKQALTTGSWKAEDYPITRTIVLFKTDPAALSILKKLNNLNMTIDFKNGIVSNGKKQIRLGKFILNKTSPFTEEERKWWIHSGQPIEKLKSAQDSDKYTIVISRNPIDIVRMSNHDGWTSCHSPNREYFQCAISDAKGAGAIAYVVNKHNLDRVDLQTPEIFTDTHRGILGIQPLARIRLRKFVNKKDNYDLAIPEDRTYGKKFAGLEDSIRDWLYNAQQDKLQGQRPRMKDFMLMGGSYQDTQAGDLFNNFFQDDLDSGDVEYSGDDEHANMAAQMQNEVDLIERQYPQNKFKICSYYVSVEETDGQPYVSYGGSVNLEVPEELMLVGPNTLGDRDDPDYLKKKNKVRDEIKQWAKNNDIYTINDMEW